MFIFKFKLSYNKPPIQLYFKKKNLMIYIDMHIKLVRIIIFNYIVLSLFIISKNFNY